MNFTVVLLDHEGCQIRSRDEIPSRKEAIRVANYYLSPECESVMESTHVALGTRKAEVRDEAGECVWDKFHPLSHDETASGILAAVSQGQRLTLDELGTTGLVNYVLGGLDSATAACMRIRQREAEDVIEVRNGKAAVALFRDAVVAANAQRTGAEAVPSVRAASEQPAPSGRSQCRRR